MTTITVVAVYRSFEVPDNMNLDDLEKSITKKLEEDFHRFGAHVVNHPNEEEAEPLFDLDKVMVSDSFRIIRG